MKNNVETRKNGVVIRKNKHGMYLVEGGRAYPFVYLAHARKHADQLHPRTDRD